MNDIDNAVLAWPPPYTLKRHPRARHVKLKASLQDGLEIIVPLRFNQKNLIDILEKNKSWIEKRLLEIKSAIPLSLPETISLASIDQVWRIFYINSANKRLQLVMRPQQELVLMGNIENKEKCYELLNQWVVQQAKTYLVNQLQQISEQTQLSFNNVVIRGQKSRWGSCTSKKNISLNYKLLFLPHELVRHILIHELCHTVHLNHSAKFWRLVASFDPQWKLHCRELRRAEKWIPAWI